MKRTKIVATVGPACDSPKILEELIDSGVNVIRLNFSHGDFASHGRMISRVRAISKRKKIAVGIIADMQGPRIRIASHEDVPVKTGEIVWVSEFTGKKMKQSQKMKNIEIDLENLASLVKVGGEIMVEDGLIKLRILGKAGKKIKCQVVDGGTIKNHKGVNIPGISGKLGALTARDKEVLKFSLERGVDFVAMSFVRNAAEIKQLKRLIKSQTKPNEIPAQVIAKIERKEAIDDFDNILKVTDAVMVARGDLGVELPQEDLPITQKELVHKSLRAGKPVIVATQMMDSMIRNPRPTRAEITDVANAVIDHADAVMLSGETASGLYPVETVKIMSRIIGKAEGSPFDDLGHGFLGDKMASISAAVAQSAHELLKDSKAKFAVVASVSGYTARMIARHRPDEGIYVVTNNQKVSNQLTLVWGVTSRILPNCDSLDSLLQLAIEAIKKDKLVKKGDKIVVVAGRPNVKKEHMSLVKVEEIA